MSILQKLRQKRQEILCFLLNEIKAKACFLSDRGFRRVSFLRLLMEQKEHSFLVRIGENLTVEFKKGKRLLKKCGLQSGHAMDPGWILLRQDGAVRLRVVGIWARGQREPWWLATNLEDPFPIWPPSMTAEWLSKNRSEIPKALALD